MATGTTFPGTIDNFNDKTDGVDDILAIETNTQSSAIEALEAKVGADSSAVTTSFDFILQGLDVSGKLDDWVLTVDSSEPQGFVFKANPGGFADPTLQRGDIIYRDSTNTLTRLGLGDAGQMLQSDGVDLVWGSSNEIVNKIVSGTEQTDGFPDYFNFATTEATLDTTTEDFIYIANGLQKILTDGEDVAFSGLSTAPVANNTCAVNDVAYADGEFTKTEGEFGDTFIVVNTMGTEITSLNNTIQAFKHGAGPEIFYAYIDSATKITPFKRGIAASTREEMANADTITLLSTSHLFLNIDGTTTYTTNNYPKYSSVDPATPTTGDWYFNTGTRLWARYSGAAWVNIDAILVGSAISDSVGVIGIEYQDFALSWSEDNQSEVKWVDTTTVKVKIKSLNVAGVVIENGAGEDIDLSVAGDRESGVSEATNTLYYIYIDKLGKARFSNICPRGKDRKLGLYHPSKYWRCVGFVFNDSGSDIVPFIHDGIHYQYQLEYGAKTTPTNITTTVTLFEFVEVPRIAINVNYFFKADYVAGTAQTKFRKRGSSTEMFHPSSSASVSSGGWSSLGDSFMQNSTIISRKDTGNGTNVFQPISFEVNL